MQGRIHAFVHKSSLDKRVFDTKRSNGGAALVKNLCGLARRVPGRSNAHRSRPQTLTAYAQLAHRRSHFKKICTHSSKCLIRHAIPGRAQLLWIIVWRSHGASAESLDPCGFHWIACPLSSVLICLKSMTWRMHNTPLVRRLVDLFCAPHSRRAVHKSGRDVRRSDAGVSSGCAPFLPAPSHARAA